MENININKNETAILMIEFQNEWLDLNGKLNHLMEDRKQFDRAIKSGAKLLSLGREAEIPIIHSGLMFQPGYPELGVAGLGLRGAIKQYGTFNNNKFGSEWGNNFHPKNGEFIVSGRTGSSAFSGSNLDIFLKVNRINTLLIAGFALHVCVESTFRQGHDLGYNCVVVEEAVSAFTAEQREYVFSHIIHHFAATITINNLNDQLLNYWREVTNV